MSRNSPIPAAPTPPAEVFYPSSESMPETGLHMVTVATLLVILREWFRRHKDVYVIGNLFWYYKEGDPKTRKSPDIMVIKGTNRDKERRVWKDWEEGIRPSFVLEVVSDDTFGNDVEDKKNTYETLGVREYFLFDPEGVGLETPLMGYRRINGVYEPLQIAGDGSLPSAELGLRLKPEGEKLAMFDVRTGKRLLEPSQMAEMLTEASRELAEREREHQEEEREAAEVARRAAQELEDQVRIRKEAERAAANAVLRVDNEFKEKMRERELRLKVEAEKEQERNLRLKEQAEKEKEHTLRLKEQAEKEKEHTLRLKEQAEKEKERRLREEAQQEIERLRALLANRGEETPPSTP